MSKRSSISMRSILAFDQPVVAPDGYGGEVESWIEVFECRGDIMYLRGGEVVQAGRLQGKQSAVITVFASDQSKPVTQEWRVRDTVENVEYNIRTKVPTDDGIYYELTCESGVAV